MSRITAISLFVAAVMGACSVWLARLPERTPDADVGAAHAGSLAATTPPVRVLLGKRNRQQVSLRVDGPYRVTAVGDWKILAQGESLPEVEVRPRADGMQIGGQSFAQKQLKLEVLEDGKLWVDQRRYHGHLHLIVEGGSNVLAVNVIELERYLAGVVTSEMPATALEAAQQSQAVVARSYALFHMKTFGRDHDYDVYDSSRSQNYKGMEYLDEKGRKLSGEAPPARQAVDQTRGVVLFYEGRLFCAFYSAVCGGHTVRGRDVFAQAAPPLVGVPCDRCQGAPNDRWEREIPWSEMEESYEKLVARVGRPLGSLREIRVRETSPGWMPIAELVGSGGKCEMPTSQLREQLFGTQLPSALFTAEVRGDRIHVSGRGWGHGVGMCQWGAMRRAEDGKTCVEILRHYYPGSQLAVVR